MRTLLIIASLLIPGSAFALSDSIIDYCLTTANPKSCLATVIAEERNVRQDQQDREYQARLELQREQSRGMALFGAGNAMINGMNQGFSAMHQPMVAPMPILPPQ